MRVLAPAKINLWLHVGVRRAGGYHEIDSLVVFADLADEIVIEEAETPSLTVSGPFASALADEKDNLVLRAARELGEAAGRNIAARFTLAKNIPVAAGLGGGSADAAAVLRALGPVHGVSPARLLELAATLGSDVPVCLASAPSFVRGRGEVVEPAGPSPSLPLLLANPGVTLATREVFARLGPRTPLASAAARALPQSPRALADFLRTTRNDLEAPARELAPVIGEALTLLAALPGALLARMSGSGATCFALFEREKDCRAAADALARAQPDWWIAPARARTKAP